MSTRLDRCYAKLSNYPPPPIPPKLSSTKLCDDFDRGSSRSSSGNWSACTNNETVKELILPNSIASNSVESSFPLEGISPAKSSALLDSHDRFKPERSQRRSGVQKMKWNEAQQQQHKPNSSSSSCLAGDLFTSLPQNTRTTANTAAAMPKSSYGAPMLPNRNLPLESESRVSSMTIADVSPRIAVKKVLLLYEHGQYRQAATFIQRLSVPTFRIILRELPIDIFVEAMPHSIPILETVYTKVFTCDGIALNLKPLRADAVVTQMVKFFSTRDEIVPPRNGREESSPSFGTTFSAGCKKILRVIALSDPKMAKTLQLKIRRLEKAVEGLGQHGLVGTTDESLLPLHDALKLEFRRVVDAYKGALQRLEDLSLANANPKSIAHGPAPIAASHQRQLSLRAEEIEDRLIKNKSLLNVVEPTLDNNCLDILLGILQRRIESDKDTLFQFTQLRKQVSPEPKLDSSVAPLLMRYSRASKQVLAMMRQVIIENGGPGVDEEDDSSSDLSGYHSDSDSTIMTSGNSPFISPAARNNFISRSLRSKTIQRPSILNEALTSSRVNTGSTSSSVALQPVRPRHVKQKSRLHKNNSLGSTCSTSTGSSSSLPEEAEALTSSTNGTGCIECVTVVSVPDNAVITQGINHKCQAAQKDAQMIASLQSEIQQLRNGLANANSTINHLQEREKKFLVSARITNNHSHSQQKQNRALRESKEERRAQLVHEYGALYAKARVETMDALDALPYLSNADELKAKLLYSVVVLSFRAVESFVRGIKSEVELVLQIEQPALTNIYSMDNKNHADNLLVAPLQSRVMESVSDYLQYSAQQHFDLNNCVQQVSTQLWATLYDYPRLRHCEGLLNYIRATVHLAWRLTNQTPACVLEYETKVFMGEMHVRFHSSDPNSEIIKVYLWPALLEGLNGQCIHKGVVIT